MENYFAKAPERLFAVLPQKINLTEGDEKKIVLPRWRYHEIEDEILSLISDV